MNFDNLIKNLYYNFVSSYAKYETIKGASIADITKINTNECNTTIFGNYCSDESFYHKCLIAANYLNYIKKHDPPFNIKHACKYLSYWVYQEVVKNSKYNYNVSTFLENVMNAEYINVCKGYTENITEELFSEIQSLIELHKCLLGILTTKENDACQRNKICVELYDGFKDYCYLKSDNHLCNEVEKFRETYNHIMYETQKCNEFKYLPSYKKHSEVSSITTPIVSFSAISLASFITYKVNNYYN
ncbi:hypothetical protein PVIIG_05578 [Plasmodium vivax India VII]|uniref:Variable surface protein n=1 Tax=Plasmodium vivax India VII TaxID=1077284 RepID=A0A0J9SJZ1_PLAVI|nr:hypothetical protein PVIIG_05578 [Plasmodium vivax India VII]